MAHEHASESTFPGQAPGTLSAPEAALADVEHDNEGNTLANWVACGGLILATLVAGVAFVLGWTWMLVLGGVLAVVCLVAGLVLNRVEARAGQGSDVPSGSATVTDSAMGSTSTATDPS